MSVWIQEKYLKQISHRIEGFTDKGNHVFNIKCPICNDSQKKKNKKRGYFGIGRGELMYSCHNCGLGISFGTFLKQFDINIYKQYRVEEFKEKMAKDVNVSPITPRHTPETQKYIPDIFADLPLVSSLDTNSVAYQFCTSRKLPIDTFEFHYAENFIAWTTGHTDKFSAWKGKDHSRIVIPWRDREGKIIGYSARALDKLQEQKYYRIFVDDSVKEKWFGLDRLDESKQIYVVEGEIDSLMISNAIAVANGKLHTYLNPKAIFISDTDTRNPHIMRNVKNMIALGLKVCMLPDNLGGKDLNELVANKEYTSDDLIDIINENTFQGLEARLKFTEWSKC